MHTSSIYTVICIIPLSHALGCHAHPGGADRVIKLWEIDSKLCVQEYHGHADVVRDVKVFSGEVFFSSSNDW